MPHRRHDAEYLRRKAVEFRQLAHRYVSPISSKILQLAEELEVHAAELEKQADND
jgi:hypothetical protein